MVTPRGIPFIDRRRSERILIRVPVRISGITKDGKRVHEKAEAVVISRHGALIKAVSELKPGSEVELENPASQQSAKFRVVWISDRMIEGKYDIGLEFTTGKPSLWGIEFPPLGSEAR